MVTQAIYAQIPIQLHGTIPVFSEPNEYTNNYEKISAEHLDSLRQHGTNPFIPEEMWIQYEDSTADLIRKYTKTGDKILDVGVGLGRLLSRFPNLQRYGMDISFGYLEVAQSKGIEVCYALVEDMPYHQETFDLVVCTDILEHVLDLNQSIAKILMVLKPEGFLIVRVPYREDLSWYLSRECSYKYVHLRNFDEHSLHLLFEKIFGCKIIEVVKAGYDDKYVKRLKMAFLIPRPLKWVLSWWLTKIKAIQKPLYEQLIKKFYDSFEINMVIIKEERERKNVCNVL